MNIEQFFSTPIGFFNLNRSLTDNEINFILNLSRRSNNGNETSVDNYILENPELADLKKFFIFSINEFIEEVYKPATSIESYITQSWANFTYSNGYHHRHHHRNSFVSGVFYVKVNSGKDKIKFARVLDQILHIEPREYNIFNAESWTFETNKNSLILFPSQLTHEVPPLDNDSHERISISFNTFLKGTIGSKVELTQINL